MSNLRADCNRCCGLCCVVPDHLALQGFRVDKPAQKPCAHLNDEHRCAIHAARPLHGYTACAGFDCFGAGQWITHTLFKGAHWTDSADCAQQMFAAYLHWAPRFEAAALLEAAIPYARDESRCSLASLRAALLTGNGAAPLSATDAVRLRRETLSVIRAALAIDAQ
jgi:hypothetical protein